MGSDLLSSLAPELICGILGQLDSPQDLFSITRASPRIYTVFVASREVILHAVLQSPFNSTALSEAIIAVRFLNANTPLEVTRGDYKCHAYKERFFLLAHLMKEAKEELQPGPTLAESVALCGILQSFQTFAQDCCRLFLATAEWELVRKFEAGVAQRVSPSDLQRHDSLSDTELGRLQRAFLRYITLQSLIHPLLPGRNESLSATDIATLFTEFTPWEIEEIGCVHQYTVNRLKKIMDEVEDDFVESVAATEQPSSSRFLPDGENKSVGLDSLEAEHPFIVNADDELGPDGVSWQESEFTDGSSTIMFLRSEKRRHSEIIQHLATLPFKCFHTLIEASNPQRRSIINRNYHCSYENLESAMTHETWPRGSYFFEVEREDRKSRQKLEFEGDHLQKRSLAWLWAHQMMPYPSYYDTCDIDLRAWGYVFWDSDRLERLKLLEEPRPFKFPECVRLIIQNQISGLAVRNV